MPVFRRISRREVIILIAIALVVIAVSITVPLVFLRSSSFVCGGVMCSPIGNAMIEAVSVHTQYGSFGNAEFIVHQINANGSLSFPGVYLAGVAHRSDDYFTCNNPNFVYVAPFNCLTSKNQLVVNVDLNPKDHNCQGIILIEPDVYSDNVGNFLGTTCYVYVISESESLPRVVFLVIPFTV
jgi:hypothetical protein